MNLWEKSNEAYPGQKDRKTNATSLLTKKAYKIAAKTANKVRTAASKLVGRKRAVANNQSQQSRKEKGGLRIEYNYDTNPDARGLITPEIWSLDASIADSDEWEDVQIPPDSESSETRNANERTAKENRKIEQVLDNLDNSFPVSCQGKPFSRR
jgi:hypothetical protein